MNNKSINLHFLKWWNTPGNKELTLQTTTKQLLRVEVSHNLQKDFAICQLSDAPHGLWHHLRFQLTWKAWCCNLKGVHLVLEECQACHLSAKIDEESIIYSLIITVFLHGWDCNLSRIFLAITFTTKTISRSIFKARNAQSIDPFQQRRFHGSSMGSLKIENDSNGPNRGDNYMRDRQSVVWVVLWVACVAGWGDQVVGVAVTFCAQRHSRWLEI